MLPAFPPRFSTSRRGVLAPEHDRIRRGPIQDERWSVDVEVRTVNNRHLKLNAKISEPYGALEPDLERLVRETVRRGTIQVAVRVERPRMAEDYRLNPSP